MLALGDIAQALSALADMADQLGCDGLAEAVKTAEREAIGRIISHGDQAA